MQKRSQPADRFPLPAPRFRDKAVAGHYFGYRKATNREDLMPAFEQDGRRHAEPCSQVLDCFSHLPGAGPRITGQRLGSVQWVGQIQSANETYLTRSGEVTSYGVPGPSDSARDSTTLVGHRFRARRSSH